MSLEPKYIYKKYNLVYGVYKHNIQMFYDLNDNPVDPKDYFDTHIRLDYLYFLDVSTNILYIFNKNDGNEYKISYDFADKVFGPYFRDIVDEEECVITTNYKGDKKSIDNIEIIDDVALVVTDSSNYIIWYDESSKQSIRQFFESHPDVNFIAFIITDPYCITLHHQIACVKKTKNNYLTFTTHVDHYPTTEKEKKEIVKMIKEEWDNKKKRNTSIEEKDEHITWDQYFMGLAILSSYRSKDPSTKVGACIINPNDNTILSLGYNGFPRGCDDNLFPWGKGNDNEEDNKYPYVVHAELNAILNAHKDLRGSVLYTTLSPCKECTKAIIQAGIKEVIYLHEFGHDDIVRKKMFDHAGVFCRQYRNPNPKNKEITLRLY